MATRSRTRMFMHMRSSVAGRGGAHYRESSMLGSMDGDVEMGLLRANGGPTQPPLYVLNGDRIAAGFKIIEKKLAQLQTAHSNHVSRPGLESSDEAMHRIEAMSADINLAFSQSKNLIHLLVSEPRPGAGVRAAVSSPEEVLIKKNLAAAFAQTLRDLMTRYRAMQTHFMSRLKARESRAGVFEDEDSGAGAVAAPVIFKPLSAAQVAVLADSDRTVQERSREIEVLARSLQELFEMFRDLGTLVTEQGTMLDQIDSNLLMTVKNIGDAVTETSKANDYHQAYRNKMCILLLVVICFSLIILLFAKHANS
eukprot:c32927_g1_i1.p2 GENE.c32927_g1_i1~~c32927_g1_i1.p2  ORF type:complete len:310 (-),score=52.14 c32927_g1_i1:169-1098(-)